MPRLHSHLPLGRMSQLADEEPVRPTELPAQASEPAVQSAELPVQPAELPVKASEPTGQLVSAQPSKLLTQVSKLLSQPSELRRLFTTFGYLVAKQGATAILGLAYWAVATHLFSAQDVGLAAAASSTAFFLGA